MKEYEQSIWRRAVLDAECEVMRLTATVAGGRRDNESAEQYVARVRKQQDFALAELQYARDKLAGVS